MNLYCVCELCNGTGAYLNNNRIIRCPNNCISLRVMNWSVEEDVVEVLNQRDRFSTTLHHLADGCQRKMQEFGLPYPRSCRTCGLGGKCKNDPPLPPRDVLYDKVMQRSKEIKEGRDEQE